MRYETIAWRGEGATRDLELLPFPGLGPLEFGTPQPSVVRNDRTMERSKRMERHFPATARDLRHAEGVGGPLQDAAEKAAEVLKATVADATERLQPTIDAAEENLGKASQLVVEKIKERPVTAAVAAMGVGLIVGLLLTRRR